MRKQKIKTILFTFIICSLLIANAKDIVAAGGEELPQLPPACDGIKVIRHSSTSLRLSWNPLKDIDGYTIYQYDKKRRTYKPIKNISATKTSWIHKKRKRNSVYRYRIAAYKKYGEKKITGPKSIWVSSKVYQRNKKKINARAPKVNKKKCNLGLCSGYQLTAESIPAKFGLNEAKRVFSPKIRWFSSDKTIATVSANGRIQAGKTVGRCTVYAVAHNGIRTGITVEVKNYAKASGYYNYGSRPEVIELISNYTPHIQKIAEYFSVNKMNAEETLEISINDNAEIVLSNPVKDVTPVQKELEELLPNYPYPISIYITSTRVHFRIGERPCSGYVAFVFDDDCHEFIHERIASHWKVCWFYPV